MIVEPASIHSRSPLRRLLRAAGFVAPIALFATIVAAGLAGPKPPQDTGVDASASALAVVSPSAVPASSPPAATAAAPVTISRTAGFPASYLTLPVASPSAVLTARSSTGGPPAVVVVAGYLSVAGQPAHCASPMITFGAWCDRLGTLFESQPAGGVDGFGSRPPHLHVTIPAGVILPAAVTGSRSAAAGAVPVEAVGRFATPGSCRSGPQACDQGFVLERVVWADGAGAPLQALLEPNQGAGLSARPPVTMGEDVVTLLAVLARPATVARLDPVAGAAAAQISTTTGPIWYVRDVILARDGSLLPRWLLLDPYTGSLIATAPSETPPVSVPSAAAAPQG